MKKLYDEVKLVLETYPETRDSDKKLVWEIWGQFRIAIGGYINRIEFMKAPSGDSITRASRMIKHKYPDLKGNKEVVKFKEEKELEKGTHIFREQLSI